MADKDSAVEYMLRILRTDYGIRDEAELDKAIRKQSVIDLSPFCGKLISHKEAV